VIRLDIGEPDFPTPEHVIEAAERALREGLTHYGPTKGLQELREAICEHLSSFGVDVRPSEVLVTPGASFALFLAFKTLLKPGEEVIVPTPTWFVYPELIRLAGGRCVFVRFSSNYEPDMEALEGAIGPKTKALVVNTPNNPTGHVLSKRDVEALTEIALEHDLYVISDEVYKLIIYDRVKHVSLGTISALKERLFLVDAFSKAYAMTGWRLGYLVAPKDLCHRAEEVQRALIMCVPPFVQKAGVAALRGPQTPVKRMVEEYRVRRDMALSILSALSGLRVRKPEGAFYIFPDISAFGLKGSELASELEREEGVRIMPGELFGPGWEWHVRISFCRPRGELSEGLKRMVRFLKALRR